MPIIKSAEKKMRQDKKRTDLNRNRKDYVKKLIREMRKNPTKDAFKKAQSAIDKLVKTKTIHKNKGARLKSRLMNLLNKSGKTKEAGTVNKAESKEKKAKAKK